MFVKTVGLHSLVYVEERHRATHPCVPTGMPIQVTPTFLRSACRISEVGSDRATLTVGS
jgi:hypothetical protein